MDTIKFILFSTVVLVATGVLGYWAVTSIQSGSEHVTTERLLKLQEENESLQKQVASLSSELDTYKPKSSASDEMEGVVEEAPVKTPEPVKTEPVKTTTTTTTYKNQTLINELQKLVTDKVTMKLHSTGTRVGTVQKFLNLYNKTTSKIDNDYGASTVKAVTAFQKDQGLTASGECGTSTFNKMIDWLKKQG